MICTFSIFKLVYFTTVNLEYYISNINIFSQLNDLDKYIVVVSKLNEIYLNIISPAIFFYFGSSNLFWPAISNIWPAFGHWQPAILSPVLVNGEALQLNGLTKKSVNISS